MFRGRRQQDAHELLRRLMDSLQEERLDKLVEFRTDAWRQWTNAQVQAWFRSIGLDVVAESVTFDGSELLKVSMESPAMQQLQHDLAAANCDKDINHVLKELVKLRKGASAFAISEARRTNAVPCLVDDVFGGLLQSHIQCLQCRHVESILHNPIP